MKKSAKGLLRVEKEDGKYVLYDQQTSAQERSGLLEVVFENSILFKDESYATIKARLKDGA